jgi:hypothetical protein
MSKTTQTVIRDATVLYEGSRSLLGYFLCTWYNHFLGVVLQNVRNWWEAGLLDKNGQPTAAFRKALFDFNALNLEKLAYICGIYFYVQSGHKKANYYLLKKEDASKRVLYLRGYDYEASVSATEGTAAGISTMDTFAFNGKLGDCLGRTFQVFKVLSPKDLYWETVGPQRYFYGDYAKIIHSSSAPIRSVFLNASAWKDGVVQLAERMDYFVVYVSSITESLLWELGVLKEKGYADRVTVVFDRRAILNKGLHAGIYEDLPEIARGRILWLPAKKRSAEEDVDALRVELEKSFTVVSADSFEAEAEALKARIQAASGALAPGEREMYLEFLFHPALEDSKLEYLRNLDAALWQENNPETGAEIGCLPFHVNQLQLRIFTSLLLGAHDKAGETLAAYAGIMEAAREFYSAAGQIDASVPEEDFQNYLGVLQDHRSTAADIAWAFLCSGRSHEFGDYTAAAKSTYDRIFTASRDRTARFMRGG